MGKSKGMKGFGLVEVVATMGVLGLGILGLVSLQTTLTRQSLDNKARAEALAIAQSRIEEMRNYTNASRTLAEFRSLYADTDGFENNAELHGVSSVFTRSEAISSNGSMKNIAVRVSWTAPDGDAQEMELNAALGFVPPGASGMPAWRAVKGLASPPTGRAELGDGESPASAAATANGDGTALARDGDNMVLIAADRVVLTLVSACQGEEDACAEFARIRGKVYIDAATQSALKPGDVIVAASHAAFCSRYFTDELGRVHLVRADAAQARSTAGGDYEYFNYSCYVGGGWHGNVGILLAGGMTGTDISCIGDPLAARADKGPTASFRRIYRGILHKHDEVTASGREEISGENGEARTRHYSHGIAGGVELPPPGSGEAGHDFVIAARDAAGMEESACAGEGVMTRPDADVNGQPGGLFAGVPGEFVCLNNGHLDHYDAEVFGADERCPYPEYE